LLVWLTFLIKLDFCWYLIWLIWLKDIFVVFLTILIPSRCNLFLDILFFICLSIISDLFYKLFLYEIYFYLVDFIGIGFMLLFRFNFFIWWKFGDRLHVLLIVVPRMFFIRNIVRIFIISFILVIINYFLEKCK
jgi:hypothetical protein